MLFGMFSDLRYSTFNNYHDDFGRMTQAIWGTLQGRLLEFTTDVGNGSRLGFHAEPFYILMAPLFLVWPDPRVLLWFKVTLVALGALPIYGLASQVLGRSWLAVCFALAYLLYPPLQYAVMFDLYGDTLAAPLLALTLWALVTGRLRLYWLALVLALMCKETVSVLCVTLGIYAIWMMRRPRLGSATLALGAVWFIIATQVVMPHFIEAGRQEVMYGKNIVLHAGPVGLTIQKIMLFLNPSEWLARLDLRYLARLFFPVGGIAWLAPEVLFIGLPVLGINLWFGMTIITLHHSALLAPIIIYAAMIGTQRLAEWLARWGACKFQFHDLAKRALLGVSLVVLVCSLGMNILSSPSPLHYRFWIPGSGWYWNDLEYYRLTAHDRVLNDFVHRLPPDVPISTSAFINPHVAQRQVAHVFPYPFKPLRYGSSPMPDWVLVDTLPENFDWRETRRLENQWLARLLNGQGYGLVNHQDGVLLLQRNPPAGSILTQQVNLVEADTAPPYPLKRDLGQRLRLIGIEATPHVWQRGERVRMSFYWQVLHGYNAPFTSLPHQTKSIEALTHEFILVDTFTCGAQSFRMVHIPLYLLYPPAKWKAGQNMVEKVEFYVPAEMPVGACNWQIGMYAAPQRLPMPAEPMSQVSGVVPVTLPPVQLQ
jgi:uncharacterized membrane protein